MAEVTDGCEQSQKTCCPIWAKSDAPGTPISVLVMNSVEPRPDKHYETYVAYRGILLGALKRLLYTTDFTFTFVEYQDYGPYLNSVNGLYEDRQKHTYWQLMVRKSDGTIIIPDIGIGCYIPNENEEIILNYTKYETQDTSTS